jgi:hypothetical protein
VRTGRGPHPQHSRPPYNLLAPCVNGSHAHADARQTGAGCSVERRNAEAQPGFHEYQAVAVCSATRAALRIASNFTALSAISCA